MIVRQPLEILDDSTYGKVAEKLLLEEFSSVEGCSTLNTIFTDPTVDIQKSYESYNGGKDIIDIILTNDVKKIFIENKLLAIDQQEQLYRYSKHNPVFLFYLTRFGHKASPASEITLKAGKDYFCVSYYDHIYHWLNRLNEKFPEDKKISNLLLWVRLSFVSINRLILAVGGILRGHHIRIATGKKSRNNK